MRHDQGSAADFEPALSRVVVLAHPPAVLFASVGDEGFSNSMAEALASGLPVIATAFSGNPETVGNEGSCGLLVGKVRSATPKP